MGQSRRNIRHFLRQKRVLPSVIAGANPLRRFAFLAALDQRGGWRIGSQTLPRRARQSPVLVVTPPGRLTVGDGQLTEQQALPQA
jgi:hypothetical protein